jgi:uncharacterized protein YvpB
VAVAAGEGLRLASRGSEWASSGEFVSQVREAEFPFNNAVLSWSAEAPAGANARFELRIRDEGGWSGWYAMGEWSGEGGRSIANQSDGRGRVDVDTLELKSPATALQYRVRLSTSSASASPLVRQVSVVYADLRAGLAGPPVPRSPGAVRDLEVPSQSQLVQEASVARWICSATSMAMVLQYLGSDVTVPDVYNGVRDRTAGIFGNWPLNTAFAAANGFDAWVDRFYSMAQVEQQIAAGRPVAISIKYDNGELAGAGTSAAPIGHLIVVRGFAANGDVIVNDPWAASSREVRKVYRRGQLERIWLRSGGIVYLVSPRADGPR